MARSTGKTKPRSRQSSSARRNGHKTLKNKALQETKHSSIFQDTSDHATQHQLRAYEEGLKFFQQQKFSRAKQALERVLEGPNKELADRARMNLRRWDEARVHLDRARKSAPKADHIVYAMAALDCLTGEAESSMQNLKIAIQLRGENRYRARNDEDFAFLQDDPRFTELLYPEREGASG